MLKKRIVVTAIALGLCLPGLSSATPLSWVPELDVVAKVGRLLGFFPGHPGTPARPARDHRKNGCGMDPTGDTCPPAGSQATTPDPTSTG